MVRILVMGIAAITLLGGALAAAPASAQRNAPFAGGKPDAKDPAVEKLAASAQKLEKQLKARPKDAKLKLKVADAYYQAGHELEYSKAGLSPRSRYRGALKYYRIALGYNPAHKEAAVEKKQIEDIYRSLPGGIPK